MCKQLTKEKTVMVVLINVFGCLDSRAEFRSSQSGWKDQIQNPDEEGHPVENIKQCNDSSTKRMSTSVGLSGSSDPK